MAIYSTFLQRAYDNIIHDIAVQHLPVIFCMDRAGLVGEDGQTHMGLYDIAYMLAVPGMTVTAPKDGDELIGLLRTALAHTGGPFCTRYPRDKVPAEPRPVSRDPGGSVRHLGVAARGPRRRHPRGRHDGAAGAGRRPSCLAAERHRLRGGELPVPQAARPTMLEALLREHRTLVTVEEGTVVNGFGAYLAETLQTTRARGAGGCPRHSGPAGGAGAAPRAAAGHSG